MANVTLTIGERQFEVAPYKLRELRKAAPFIAEMNVLAKRIDESNKAAEAEGRKPDPNLEDLFALSRALCEIIAIGVVKVDPTMDADEIEGAVDLTFLASLQNAARALLEQSGLSSKGEAEAPLASPATGPEAEPSEALANSSEELSPS